MLTHRRRTLWRALATCIALALFAGCAGSPPAPAGPAVATSPTAAVPAGARAYDVDPAGTHILLLVYRAGPFARFAHNHAITSDGASGVLWVGATPATSGFEIHVPVASLVVDDPAARAAAGPEFPGAVPDDARAGTTTNLRRAEVLDLAHHPEVVVRSVGITGSWQQAVVRASVRLKDVERELEVPVALDLQDASVTATGEFQIRQTDFGITPFSVAGGAIQVADVVDVRFQVRGVRPVP